MISPVEALHVIIEADHEYKPENIESVKHVHCMSRCSFVKSSIIKRYLMLHKHDKEFTLKSDPRISMS